MNKCQLIGRLGQDPERRTFPNGGSVVNFSLATSERWKDKQSGERRERTQWHKIAIFSEPLGKVAYDYLKKGSQVYLEGQLETRKWQASDGSDRWTTEVVLRPFNSSIELLGSKNDNGGGGGGYQGDRDTPAGQSQSSRQSDPFEYDDEIPFAQAIAVPILSLLFSASAYASLLS